MSKISSSALIARGNLEVHGITVDAEDLTFNNCEFYPRPRQFYTECFYKYLDMICWAYLAILFCLIELYPIVIVFLLLSFSAYKRYKLIYD